MSNHTPPWNGSQTINGVTTYYHNGVVVPPPKTYSIPRPTIRFGLKAMERICLAPIESFSAYGEMNGANPDRFFYADHGSNILAVAHLDSVEKHKHFVTAKVEDETIVYNAQLDDRLGAYIILDLLPKLGIQCDILLTEGEETGRSTARHFATEKQYNWMFSFDRMGTDVVMYKYETPKLSQMLRESDFRVGHGSFSDICCLESLGCAGFNFGCGYADYHSKLAHVQLSDTALMIQSFMHFYQQHKDEYLEHKARDSYVSRASTYIYPPQQHWERDIDYGDCDWRTGGNVNRSMGGRHQEPKDDREKCVLCEKMVDPENYVYGASSCYDCLKAYMEGTEVESRQTLQDIIDIMELEGMV